MTLVGDIDTLTAGYLAALKSNSDEIARLAEALRKAEAELDNAREEISGAHARMDDYGIARTSEESTGLTHSLQWRIGELGDHKLSADNHILKLEAKLMDMEEQRDAAEDARADDYRTQTETVRALLAQRDTARTNIIEARHILKCPEGMTLSDWCQNLADDLAASETIRANAAERDKDAARADAEHFAKDAVAWERDAERLAVYANHKIGCEWWSSLIDRCDCGYLDTLAAHRAAAGKAVPG